MAELGSVTVTAGDVAEMWRPLSVAETAIADKLLDRAAAILPSRSPGLLDRLDSGEVPPEAVEQTLIDAVLRVLRNPEGWRRGSRSLEGEYSETWEWDEGAAMASLHFSTHELGNLAGFKSRRGRAFSINTTPRSW